MFNVHLSVRRGIIGRVPARSSKIDPNLAKAEPCFKWGQNDGFGISPLAPAQKELVPVREVKRAEESHQCWNTLRGICSDQSHRDINCTNVWLPKVPDLRDVPKYGPPVFLGGSLFLHFALRFWNQTWKKNSFDFFFGTMCTFEYDRLKPKVKVFIALFRRKKHSNCTICGGKLPLLMWLWLMKISTTVATTQH